MLTLYTIYKVVALTSLFIWIAQYIIRKTIDVVQWFNDSYKEKPIDYDLQEGYLIAFPLTTLVWPLTFAVIILILMGYGLRELIRKIKRKKHESK